MTHLRLPPCLPLRFRRAACVLAAALTGCAVGPDHVRPEPAAPEDWSTWRSGDESLRVPVAVDASLPPEWWRAFHDPVLDRLQQRAVEASPDLQTAALHFAQARVQRVGVAAQQVPQIDLTGGVTRQRQSENNAGMRLVDAIGFPNRDALAKLIAEPFSFYQVGFDASWEPDLWGRVSRSVEAADADVLRQAALLDLARLSLASDVARNYFELRTTQRQIKLLREDIAALEDRLSLFEARAQAGVIDDLDLERQRAEVAGLKAQLPPLLAQEGVSANRIALLLGARPGALRPELTPTTGDAPVVLPDLALGLPSEVARRRPDIRAAEARLHSATAGIGIARADLYPSIVLGARAGYESYLGGEFVDWGSHTWSVGLSLDLPLFDRGRRKSVVQLRELQQQEAAVAYQRTVLQAWQEIDDALNGYTAERQQAADLEARVRSAGQAYELARARYDGGTVDFIAVLDSERSYLQARRELVASNGRLSSWFVALNKAIGNTQPQ
ncbi:MAG TPA: efflux transporter outer membrane subunit [Burkholderiaceae bacterium]|nr:efflux transporter outer membrane subunit [Burkholderiaceae bacterium]